MNFFKFLNNSNKPLDNIAFIFGCPRSGTTWLWSLLESHLDVIPYVKKNKGLNGLYPSSESGIYCQKTKNPKKQLRSFCISNKDKLVIEKTPIHTFYYDKIKNDFPYSKMVIIFRHPIAILSSMLNSKMNAFKDYNYEKAIHEINKYYKKLIFISKSQDSYYLTYEKLYENTEFELFKLFNYLNLNSTNIQKIIDENNMKTKVSVEGAFRKAKPNSYNKELDRELLKKATDDLFNEILYFNIINQ